MRGPVIFATGCVLAAQSLCLWGVSVTWTTYMYKSISGTGGISIYARADVVSTHTLLSLILVGTHGTQSCIVVGDGDNSVAGTSFEGWS